MVIPWLRRKHIKLDWRQSLPVIEGLVIVGVVATVLAVTLDGPKSTAEAEDATSLKGGARVVSDTSASGGKSLHFGTPSPSPSNSGTSGSPSSSPTATSSASPVPSPGNIDDAPTGMLAGNQGYCAQPNQGVRGFGTRLVTQTCNESPPEIVQYLKNSTKDGGMVRFEDSGLCMVENGTADASQVQLGSCDSADDDARWIPTSDGALKNGASGRCLRPKGGAVGPNLYLEITTCNATADSPNQKWSLPYGSGNAGSAGDTGNLDTAPTGMLAGNQGYCAQPNGGFRTSGTRLVTQACNESPPEIVKYLKNASKDGGMVYFDFTGFCMVEDGTDDLSQVKLGTCDPNDNAARWIPTSDSGLKNAESGLCLRPKGGGVGVGFYLEVTHCNSTSASPNQKWSLPVKH